MSLCDILVTLTVFQIFLSSQEENSWVKRLNTFKTIEIDCQVGFKLLLFSHIVGSFQQTLSASFFMSEFLKRQILLVLSLAFGAFLVWTTILFIFSSLKLFCWKDSLHWKCEVLASVMGTAGMFLPSWAQLPLQSMKGLGHHAPWDGSPSMSWGQGSCLWSHSPPSWGDWHLPGLYTSPGLQPWGVLSPHWASTSLLLLLFNR